MALFGSHVVACKKYASLRRLIQAESGLDADYVPLDWDDAELWFEEPFEWTSSEVQQAWR